MDTGSCILCWLFVINIKITHSYNECYTPDELVGECININKCPSLLMLSEIKKKNSSTDQFLQNLKCGYDGNEPKLCCALNNESSGSSTVTTLPPTTTEKIDSSAKFLFPSTCGRSNSSHTRIVGGTPAELGAWPWMAALGYQDLRVPNNSDYQWLCGGSLITESYVLTAAHCLKRERNRKLTVVRLGDLDLNSNVQDFARPLDVTVSRIISHEHFWKFTNDIGLLKLAHPVQFNDLIQPVCLPISTKHRNFSLANMVSFVAGWGTTAFRGSASSALMEVQVPVWDNEECKQPYANQSNVIDDRVLCAGMAIGGKDACTGDSGGPLMWNNENQYYLIGVVSYGYKCGESGYPGIYTRVTYFVDWILDKINNS